MVHNLSSMEKNTRTLQSSKQSQAQPTGDATRAKSCCPAQSGKAVCGMEQGRAVRMSRTNWNDWNGEEHWAETGHGARAAQPKLALATQQDK